MRGSAALTTATLCVIACVAGCGSGPPDVAAPPAAEPVATATEAAPATAACPAATGGERWPAEVPADLPTPAGLAITGVTRPNELVVRFRQPTDLQGAVRYWLGELPRHGFTLGTGDSEAEEADIPFSRGQLRARLKLSVADTCVIDGLLALAGQ